MKLLLQRLECGEFSALGVSLTASDVPCVHAGGAGDRRRAAEDLGAQLILSVLAVIDVSFAAPARA